MSIRIENLHTDDVGKWVIYKDNNTYQKGKIKSWNDKYVFVVFHCGNDWRNFQNYTAVATDPLDLAFTQSPI